MFKKIKALLLVTFTMISLSLNSYTTNALQSNILDSINGQYGIIIDYQTNQIIATKNADDRLYPASLTKMLTAIVAMENLTDLNQTVTITDEMLDGLAAANASMVGFKAGDTPTIQDLFYGIALPSGADATNAVAYTISGSIEAYVELMNQKAQEIGMSNSHFVNTTGLHDENHYSTARDLAKLLQYCLTNETFKTVFSTHEYTTSALVSAPSGIALQNTIFKAATTNNYSIPGLIGGKTGFTYPAGHCLAAWSQVNDMNLITVVCNADAYAYNSPHIQDTDIILNDMQSWNTSTLIQQGTTVKTITIDHLVSEDETIEVTAPETVTLDLPIDATITTTCTLPDTVVVKNEQQSVSGELTITANNELVYTTTLMIKVDPEKNLIDKFLMFLKNL